MKNPSCIDLLLIKNSYTFPEPTTVGSSLSNYHKPVLNVLKPVFLKANCLKKF